MFFVAEVGCHVILKELRFERDDLVSVKYQGV